MNSPLRIAATAASIRSDLAYLGAILSVRWLVGKAGFGAERVSVRDLG